MRNPSWFLTFLANALYKCSNISLLLTNKVINLKDVYFMENY